MDIRWNPPNEGWTKVNVDRASKGNPKEVGYGGLVKDANDRWLGGFMCNLGNCSAIITEF